MAGSVTNLFALKEINHQTKVEGGVLADECGELLREFFKQRRS
jgi:tRNA(adenine34) deaminase